MTARAPGGAGHRESARADYLHRFTVVQSAEERFWAKVDKQASCWLWTAATNSSGYGKFWDGERIVKAHRWAYTHIVGPIPDGLWVLHNCPGGDNPACVNPEHLWLGDVNANVADMMAKGGHVALSGDQHWFKKHPELRARGEKIWTAKLTPEDVLEIRRLHSSVGTRELARRFNVAKSTVENVLSGRRWSHV